MTRTPLPYATPALVVIAAAALLAPLSLKRAAAQDEVATPPTREELQAQYEEAVANGREEYAAGEYEAAIESFDLAVRLTGGNNATSLYLRAQALIGAEEYAVALEDLKAVLTIGQATPGLPARAQNLQAEAYLELGAVDRALKAATQAVKADRNVPEFQLNYGRALVSSGDAGGGEKALTKYIEADEQDPLAYRFRALAYTGLGKYPRALLDIDQAIELDPEDYENYFTKGQIYLQEKDYEPAAAAIKQAIDAYEPEDPDLPMPYVQAHLTRASVLEEIGKEKESDGDTEAAKAAYEEEKQECERLLDELPDNPAVATSKASALFRLGVAERLLGNLAPSIKAFTEAIDINPGLGEAYFRRGICFFYLGEPGLALGDFRQGAAINWDSPRSNLWKGRCQAELGDYREAVKDFSSAIAVSDRYTIAYVHRGLTYLQLGEHDRALADFNAAIRLEVTVGRHYYHQGLAYKLKGDRKRAVNSFVNAIKFAPEMLEAYEAAATIFDQAGRPELADAYRQAAAAQQQPSAS
ncbi:MAG: tetratricopeptide repeat protein [Planctomycetota bacterium]